MTYRLIIAGSRTCDSEEDYQRLLPVVLQYGRPDEIISGGAKKGGDRMGEKIAAEYGIPLKQFIPDWENKGKGAGFLRNGDMAVYASDASTARLIALWDGQSRGTEHMIGAARQYQLDVVVVQPVPQLIAQRAVEPEVHIFKQSHSSLNVFETCPRQYYAKYISREVKFVQGAAAKWGDDVHKALEDYLLTNGRQALPVNMAQYQPCGDMLLARAAKWGGKLLAERQAAVKHDHTATHGRDRGAWLGGKIDVTIVYPTGVAEVFDWKTGKVKNDVTQLKLYAGFAFADYPEVQTVRSGFVWLGEKAPFAPPLVLSRPELPGVWSIFEHKFNLLKDAYQRNAWPERPNGLCRQYCDVTACQYHGKGRA